MGGPETPGRDGGEATLPLRELPVEPGTTDAQRGGRARRARWRHSGTELLHVGLIVLQVAVAISLLVVAVVVLVRTLVTFLGEPGDYPTSLISALDGILVVIILVDILHTVVTHLRDVRVPLRPFLVIGVLAGIRDILSASARLELTGHQSSVNFNQSVIELGVGVGVVVVLLAGLVILGFASKTSGADEEP